MDLIIKLYNQYFRNFDSQRWNYVGYQYWYNVGNRCCTNAVHRYHFDYPPTVGFQQSEVGIQRMIDVGPIVNFCLDKDKCYANHLETIEALKHEIEVAIHGIEARTIENLLKNCVDWMGYCKASRGSHMNDIVSFLNRKVQSF